MRALKLNQHCVPSLDGKLTMCSLQEQACCVRSAFGKCGMAPCCPFQTCFLFVTR